jgi:hypothetical protein
MLTTLLIILITVFITRFVLTGGHLILLVITLAWLNKVSTKES